MNPCKKAVVGKGECSFECVEEAKQRFLLAKSGPLKRERENLVKFESACSHKKTEGPSTLSLSDWHHAP